MAGGGEARLGGAGRTPGFGRRTLLQGFAAAAGMALLPATARARQGRSWSIPQALPSAGATRPVIATDAGGNCAAIWYGGPLNAANLRAGASDHLGRPAWQTTDPVAGTAQTYDVPWNTAIDMDASGNAMAAWHDGGGNILVALLVRGATAWNPANIVNTGNVARPPVIAVAPNGNAVVLWASRVPWGDNAKTVFHANSYDAAMGSWQGQTDLFGGAALYPSSAHAVDVDAIGNAVAVISTSYESVSVASFSFATNRWNSVTPIAAGGATLANVALDLAGNATIVWFDGGDASVSAAILAAGQTALTDEIQISIDSAASDGSLPGIGVDAYGNVLALWTNRNGGLASARRETGTTSWQAIPPFGLGGPVSTPALAVDGFGHALAVWSVAGNPSGSDIQASALSGKIGVRSSLSWEPATTLSVGTVDLHPKAAITRRGDAVAIWDSDGGIIASSVYPHLFNAGFGF